MQIYPKLYNYLTIRRTTQLKSVSDWSIVVLAPVLWRKPIKTQENAMMKKAPCELSTKAATLLTLKLGRTQSPHEALPVSAKNST